MIQPPSRIAIVHDWLVSFGGSERVVDALLELFPNADLFSLVCAMPDEPRGQYRGRRVTTSFIQRLPFGASRYRSWLPLMPLAVEQFDLSAYDLVISSSHCVAKGVLTGPAQKHICYCYSPMRYAWDLQHQYLRESGNDKGIRGLVARYLLHRMRIWDSRTANGVDHFVTLSRHIARRITKCYRRDSAIVYPPVDVDRFPLRKSKEDFFVTASRMVPYKLIPLIVAAFAAMPDRRLVVIGDGPEWGKCVAAARGHRNIQLMGHLPQPVLCDYLQRAAAFVFAAEEDFGIAPLEAQACGTPVIAYGRGGILDTITDGETGIFFPEQTVAAIVDAVSRFDRIRATLTPADCRTNAERFTIERFKAGFLREVMATAEWTSLDGKIQQSSRACAG